MKLACAGAKLVIIRYALSIIRFLRRDVINPAIQKAIAYAAFGTGKSELR